MEATRLAPAGRACSKFVWQCRLLKNWAVRMLRYSGRPVFRQIAHRRRVRITNRRGVGLSLRLWRFDTQLSISALLKRGRISSSDLIRPPKCDRFCPLSLRDTGRFPAPFAGHVVAAIGGHSSRPKCGGRRASDSESWVRASWADRRAAPRSAWPGSEFVSEFETKQDQ